MAAFMKVHRVCFMQRFTCVFNCRPLLLPSSFPFGYTLCRNSFTDSRCHSNSMTAACSPRSRRHCWGKRAAADMSPHISLNINAMTHWGCNFLQECSAWIWKKVQESGASLQECVLTDMTSFFLLNLPSSQHLNTLMLSPHTRTHTERW